MKQHVIRTLGFALVPALSLLSSLLVLPIISARYGGAGWGALTLGQSVGALISVFIGMSWPVVGGYMVATADNASERVRLYALSHYSRLCVLGVFTPFGAVLSYILSPAYGFEAVLFCVGTAFNGLSAAWFFSGTGNPRPLITNEGLVRLAMYGIAILGLSYGLGLDFYAVVYVCAGLVMVALNWRTVMKDRVNYTRPRAPEIRNVLRQQFFGTLSRTFQAAFTFGGPIIMAGLRPFEMAIFSGYDQLQKSGTGAATAVTNSLVNWSSSPAKTRYGRRSSVALSICAAGSIVFLVSWVIFGHHVVAYVFAGELQPSRISVALVGVNVCLVFLLSSFELLVMVPRGLATAVYRHTLCASAFGLGAVIVGALTLGTDGALAATWIYAITSIALHVKVLMSSRSRLAEQGRGASADAKGNLQNYEP